MKVRDVMTAPAITLGPEACAGDIARSLIHHDISGIPIVDDMGVLIGIVTEADLMLHEAFATPGRRALALVGELVGGYPETWRTKIDGHTAQDLMSFPVVTANPDDTLDDAARRMLRHPCKRLPVVRDGHVIGMLSRHDILRRYDRTDRDIAQDVATLVTQILGDDHRVDATVQDGVVELRGTPLGIDDVDVLTLALAGLDGVVDVIDATAERC